MSKYSMNLPIIPRPERKFSTRSKLLIEVGALSPESCAELISMSKNQIKHYPSSAPSKFESTLIHDPTFHSLLVPLWEKAIAQFGTVISGVETYEIKKYNPGCYFASHVDYHYGLESNIERKLTCSVHLSSPADYVGGNLKVMNLTVPNAIGTVTFFPSFYPHEVTPVISGERWSLIGFSWGPDWV